MDTGVAANPDIFSYPAGVDNTTTPPTNVPPAANDTVTVGSTAFPLYPTQDRNYSFGAMVTPTVTDPGTGAEATATVDPKTGGILQRRRDQPRQRLPPPADRHDRVRRA